jgi:hypothetical protein
MLHVTPPIPYTFRLARRLIAASAQLMSFVVSCRSYEPLPMSVYSNVCTSWFFGNVYVRTASAVPVVVT